MHTLSSPPGRSSAVSNGSSRPTNRSRRRKRTTRTGRPRPPRCGANPSLNCSFLFFDRVAAADGPAFDHAAEHATPPVEFFPEPRPNLFHQVARRADGTHFQSHVAYPERLPKRQAVHVHPLGGDVFAEDAWRQIHRVQGFPVYQEHLTWAVCPRVHASLETCVRNRLDFRELFHRHAPLRSAK